MKLKNKLLLSISPMLYDKIIYRRIFNKKLNLKNPEGFNEKLLWLKYNKYYKNPLIIKCADKLKVREYVTECGCKEILNSIIGTYDNVEEINWDTLPEKFAMKCNHGAGYNIICTDKNKLDIEECKKKLKKWMKEDYSKKAGELQYKYIKRKIICEKYIEMGEKKFPTDYKIYCFNGKAKIILVMNDRDTNVTREFYDTQWNRMHLRDYEGSPAKPTEKPYNLTELIKYAEILSKPFEFVRVDLYNVNRKVIFGELTFSPTGCLAKYTDEASKMMGNWIELEGI